MTPGMVSHEEQLDMWRHKLDAWYIMMQEAHLPMPAEPPPFVWDLLRGEALLRDTEAKDATRDAEAHGELRDKVAIGQLAARLGGEAKGEVTAGGGYFGALQTAAEISAKQHHAAAIELLRAAAREAPIEQSNMIWRALELLGVKP